MSVIKCLNCTKTLKKFFHKIYTNFKLIKCTEMELYTLYGCIHFRYKVKREKLFGKAENNNIPLSLKGKVHDYLFGELRLDR